MTKRQVFYSFHYENDVRRAAQIRAIGVLEGNEPVSENDWEDVKKGGNLAIKKWINKNMENRSCLIVLVGSDTAKRQWVKYEIEYALKRKMGVFGIYIHNIKDPLLCKEGKNGTCLQGENPFINYTVNGSSLKCYNPASNDAYEDIKRNLSSWVEEAISQAKEID